MLKLDSLPKDLIIVKKKREREVYFSPSQNLYYKIWVKNWSQAKIVKFCIDSGFYDKENLGSFVSLIVDNENLQRGYVQKKGQVFLGTSKDDIWKDFIDKTDESQRAVFLIDALERSVNIQGVYVDLHPSNLILFEEKINFIDLDSFRSYDLVFNSKKAEYEKGIDLDAWWKPRESALTNLKESYGYFMKECLGLTEDIVLDEEIKFVAALNLLREKYEQI